VLACIRVLLSNPNPQGGWNNLATRLLRENRDKFKIKARKYVQRYITNSS
jgi:ubiquitin-protein ligase